MTIIYTGDFVSATHTDVGSVDVIAIDAPELLRDDSVPATTGSTGAEHEEAAGGRYKTGEAKLVVPWDSDLLALTPGTANGSVTASPLALTAITGTVVTISDMVLKKVSSSTLKVKGGQPTMELIFTKHNVGAVA